MAVLTTTRRTMTTVAAGAALAAAAAVLSPPGAGAVVPTADLSVQVSHSPSAPQANTDVTFTLTAANDGPDTAADVLVAMSFDYPMGLQSMDSGCSLSRGTQSVVCSVGDVASGATASVQVVLRPSSSGVYTLPVATSSETADPDTADRAATDTVIVKPGVSMGERYVAGELPVVLERPAGAEALAYWGARFQNAYFFNRSALVKVPAGWINSNEYRRLRVREAYLRILTRAARPSDVTYWTNKLAHGLDYQSFDRRLISSHEFAAQWQGGPSDQVDGIIHSLLGRGATDAEVNAIAPDLASGRRTRAAVALDIQRSATWRGQQVDALYQKVFGSAPDALSRYGGILDLGHMSPEALFANLLVNWRVLNQYPPSDDDYPTYAIPVFNYTKMAPLGS